MKFCCGIVLYYPSKEELSNIYKYGEVFERIYIFDNTEGNTYSENRDYFSSSSNFEYISYSENKGLSVAYNTVCKKAILDGYDYICLFDQDSVVQNDGLKKIMEYIRNDKNEVALYVPEIIFKHKDSDPLFIDDNTTGVEVDWAISSGSFINLLVYKKTEGFDENYFIDRVDLDYCLTARGLGYKVIKVKNVLLYQTLGEQGKGIFKGVSQHSPIRHYYIFRNRLYFYLSKNVISDGGYRKVVVQSLQHIFRILLLERYKFNKIKMMLIGLNDYKKGKMGKFSGR